MSLALNFTFWINKLMSRIYLSNLFHLNQSKLIKMTQWPLKPWTLWQDNKHFQPLLTRTYFKAIYFCGILISQFTLNTKFRSIWFCGLTKILLLRHFNFAVVLKIEYYSYVNFQYFRIFARSRSLNANLNTFLLFFAHQTSQNY